MKKFILLMTTIQLIASSASAQVQGGRYLPPDRETFRIGLAAGSAFGLDGEVKETTRPYYESLGIPGAPPEDYSWDELGFDDSFPVYGLNMEKMWPYVTLQGRLFRGAPELNGTADRDYYIGVEDIAYGGRDYEYMKIPAGTDYSGDIDAWSMSLGLRITPVSFGNDDYIVEFTPWIHLGLFAFYGDYTIDAGPATGVVQYESPPRDYVVGGRGTGMSGIVMPELGLGGEFRIYVTEGATLIAQGNAGILKFDGNTGDFGISSRNEKDLEIDYLTLSARLMLELALNPSLNMLFGVEIQSWTADAESRATAKTEEEILALREKFDKDIRFEMNTVMAFVGFSF